MQSDERVVFFQLFAVIISCHVPTGQVPHHGIGNSASRYVRTQPIAPVRGGLSLGLLDGAGSPPHHAKPMCARDSFFAADSTSSAAMRRALSAPFFPARK